MPAFNWMVRFKGESVNRVFKGTASTKEDVDIGEMMHALMKFVGRKHKHLGLTKITASIRRAKEHNTKGEQKP
jgi:hypothetical protein